MSYLKELTADLEKLADSAYHYLDAARTPVIRGAMQNAAKREQEILLNLQANIPEQDDAAFRRSYNHHYARMTAFGEVDGFLEAVINEIERRQSANNTGGG